MQKTQILSWLVASMLFIPAQGQAPPVARPQPHSVEIHGQKLDDPYHWLRDKKNPEVRRYLEAENEYTDKVMGPTKAFQEELYKECLARIQETDSSAPYPDGSYLYWSQTEKGKQYRSYWRAPKSDPKKAATVLDLNELAVGQQFMALHSYEVSDDGNWLAYSTDNTGYRQYKLHFKDLRNGQLHAKTFDRVGSVFWLPDNKTVFFTTEDDVSKRSDKFWRYTLGDGDAQLVFEEKDDLFDVVASRSKEGKMLFLRSIAKTSSEVRYASAANPAEWKVFRKREAGHEYDVDHRNGNFYVLTNKDATNFRVCRAPESDPAAWSDFVAHDPEVKIESFDLFQSYVALSQRRQGTQELRVKPDAGETYLVALPEPVRAVDFSVNAEFASTSLRYDYESPVTPSSVFELDMASRASKLVKQMAVLGDFRAGDYACERIWLKARDGVQVPVTLVYKKGLDLKQPHPTVLYGYGSYGVSYDPSFSSNRVSLLKRGVVYAIAHIRGGGELGEPWRLAGRMEKKMTTFHDFIDVAEGLIRRGTTSADRLVITGGSAGGLLMGVVSNQRPELFKAVVSKVPFVDVINTMLDESLPLTTSEFIEWGNPKEKAAFDTMVAYSPYDQVKAQKYPAMLVEVSYFDSQVPYWEGAKLVARLREKKTDDNQILLKTNFSAGHGGASGRYDYLREVAFDYAYMLWQIGVWKN